GEPVARRPHIGIGEYQRLGAADRTKRVERREQIVDFLSPVPGLAGHYHPRLRGHPASLSEQTRERAMRRIVLALGDEDDLVIAIILRQDCVDVLLKAVFEPTAGNNHHRPGLIASLSRRSTA